MPNYLSGAQDDLHSIKRFGSSFTDAILGAAAANSQREQRQFQDQMEQKYYQLAEQKSQRDAAESGPRIEGEKARTAYTGAETDALKNQSLRAVIVQRLAAQKQLGIGREVPTDEGRQSMMRGSMGLRGEQANPEVPISVNPTMLNLGSGPVNVPIPETQPMPQVHMIRQGGINDVLHDPKMLMQLSSDLGQMGVPTQGGLQDPEEAQRRIVAALTGSLSGSAATSPAAAARMVEPMETSPGTTIRNPLTMGVMAQNPYSPAQSQTAQLERNGITQDNNDFTQQIRQMLAEHQAARMDADARAQLERADKAKNNAGGGASIGGLHELLNPGVKTETPTKPQDFKIGQVYPMNGVNYRYTGVEGHEFEKVK